MKERIIPSGLSDDILIQLLEYKGYSEKSRALKNPVRQTLLYHIKKVYANKNEIISTLFLLDLMNEKINTRDSTDKFIKYNKKNPTVRVSMEAHALLKSITVKTGRSIQDVIDELLFDSKKYTQ